MCNMFNLADSELNPSLKSKTVLSAWVHCPSVEDFAGQPADSFDTAAAQYGSI